MDTPLPLAPGRAHLSRLKQLWRSGGWPCRDSLELELLAAGWITPADAAVGEPDTLRLTDAGIRVLADAAQRGRRAVSRHDRLAQRMARHLQTDGRIVWHELSLRAQVMPPEAASPTIAATPFSPAPDLLGDAPEVPGVKPVWRLARPDLFSVRNTSLEAALHPVVHEIKVSRADLLSDLRQAAKRESYQWLCCECYYVFPAGTAEPREIPEALGLWVVHGDVETGRLELLRPARHTPCTLPFAVWMALAKATPLALDDEPAQTALGAPGAGAGRSPEVPALRVAA